MHLRCLQIHESRIWHGYSFAWYGKDSSFYFDIRFWPIIALMLKALHWRQIQHSVFTVICLHNENSANVIAKMTKIWNLSNEIQQKRVFELISKTFMRSQSHLNWGPLEWRLSPIFIQNTSDEHFWAHHRKSFHFIWILRFFNLPKNRSFYSVGPIWWRNYICWNQLLVFCKPID